MEEKNLTENENNGTADSKKFFADMFDWMCSIFSAILCFIIIFALFARVITVDGESMVPTLQDQQDLSYPICSILRNMTILSFCMRISW